MSIVVDSLLKTFDDHVVVNRVSFEVAEGECFVLLGPSGSGKSTVLRIVAGLTCAEAGRVLLHGKEVTHATPQSRGVGMVFQQYALFGHMTVSDNIEFPLRVRKLPAHERAKRRDELLELVGLVGFQKRFPHQLSGGQQQRVALARALAHRPQVLLLDEPFGALDARIRTELRRTLRRIQREVAVTTIFVTHDQDEAFELADHLAVMDHGRLLEVGAPQDLYLRPQTEFVATFLGKANLFVGQCTADEVRLGEARFPLEGSPSDGDATRRVLVLFRPEDVAVKLTRDALDWPAIGEGIVEETEFSGSIERLRLRIPGIPGARPIAPAVPFGADSMLLDSTRSQHLGRRYPLAVGDRAWIGVRRVHALAHRGLGFAVVDRGTSAESGTLEYAGHVARSCHARVTLLAAASDGVPAGVRLQAARARLGDGLVSLESRCLDPLDPDALKRQGELDPEDILIVSKAALDDGLTLDGLLRAGGNHLLLVPERTAPPQRVLVCAAAGEPGKHDIFTAGRIFRHLGSAVTILTVLTDSAAALRDQVARFHEAARRTLSLYGIEASALVREGDALAAILDEIRGEQFDFLVLGSPLPASVESGAIGLLEQVLQRSSVPTLIVRHGEGAR